MIILKWRLEESSQRGSVKMLALRPRPTSIRDKEVWFSWFKWKHHSWPMTTQHRKLQLLATHDALRLELWQIRSAITALRHLMTCGNGRECGLRTLTQTWEFPLLLTDSEPNHTMKEFEGVEVKFHALHIERHGRVVSLRNSSTKNPELESQPTHWLARQFSWSFSGYSQIMKEP